MACSEAWLERIGSEEISEASDINNKTMKCLQRCERQSETPTFTSSVFPVDATFSQHQFFCLALKKVSRICSDSSRVKIFEAILNETEMSCLEILNTNKKKPYAQMRVSQILQLFRQIQKCLNFCIIMPKQTLPY